MSGWAGLLDTQLAIIERLKALGVRDVGLVYNFTTARDPLHDDVTDFQTVWAKIHPHVVAVDILGMTTSPPKDFIYPGQRDWI